MGRCGVGWLGCECGIRWGKVVVDFEDQELCETVGGGFVGDQGGQAGEVEAGRVVVLADPEGVCESGFKGACGEQVQGRGAGVGWLEDDGEAGRLAAIGAEDRTARDGCIDGQREGEGRAVSAIGEGHLVPEVHGLIVIGAGPAVGHLSGVMGGEGGLMPLEEEVSGEEVILGAPGLEFFGGERGLVGGVHLSLSPLNQGQFD